MPLAVSFLCHFPAAFAALGRPTVLPFGRTFLEPRRACGHPARGHIVAASKPLSSYSGRTRETDS
jgi:hypothetical protein